MFLQRDGADLCPQPNPDMRRRSAVMSPAAVHNPRLVSMLGEDDDQSAPGTKAKDAPEACSVTPTPIAKAAVTETGETPNKRSIDLQREDKDEQPAQLQAGSHMTADRNKKRRTSEEQAAGSGNKPSRTVYFGGVTAKVSANDLLNHVRGGAVEALRFLTEKSCAFIDFVDDASALAFYNRLNDSKRFNVRGTDIKVGWAKPSPISPTITTAIKNGATRNVYLGGISVTSESTPEEVAEVAVGLRAELEQFGMIDMIKVVPEKQCAFVHLTTVADAMKAVNMLGSHERWRGKRVNFGRDRSADRLASAAPTVEDGQICSHASLNPNPNPNPNTNSNTNTNNNNNASNVPIRTIYLGAVPPQTTAEDLCNIIRGGLLEKIRITAEKRCAFVTFVESAAAEAFYEFSTRTGIWVHGQRLKPGWAKPAPLPGQVISALRQGATRNVYIGNIELAKVSEDDLRQAFLKFGEIEMINFLRKEKNVAFVNFCLLTSAVKAVESARHDPLFQHCKIGYGKDRCAQPLKLTGDCLPTVPLYQPPPQLLPHSSFPPTAPPSGHILLPVSCLPHLSSPATPFTYPSNYFPSAFVYPPASSASDVPNDAALLDSRFPPTPHYSFSGPGSGLGSGACYYPHPHLPPIPTNPAYSPVSKRHPDSHEFYSSYHYNTLHNPYQQ